MPFEFFIGSRYLRAKQKLSFISLITLLSIAGVTVGVMALIVVIAVMTGFETDMKARILGVESHIVVMRHGGSFSDYRNVMTRIKAADGVLATTPFVYSQVMIRSARGVSGAVLRGVDPVKDQAQYDELFKEIVSLQAKLEEVKAALRDAHDGQEA